jgi:Zn-dependent M16 (insulinase) family peptidase
MDDLPEEYYPYAALLKGILTMVDTADHTYGDLNNELDLATGGFGISYGVYPSVRNLGEYHVDLELKTKYLYDRTADAMKLTEEVLFTSKLRDYDRMLEILEELRSQIQGSLLSYGHQVAFGRLAAAITPDGVIREKMSGLEFYRFISDLVEHYDSRKEEMAGKLEETAKMLLRPENMFVDFTGEKTGLDALEETIAHLCGRLCTEPVTKAQYQPQLLEAGEGLMTSGQVQYVCRAGDFRKKGLPYTGALRVLKVLMGYDYLWVNIRVKGGAYGCMSSFSRTGVCSFATYRDPHLKNSIDIFEKAPEAIASWDADERGMTQLIIGTFSDMDTPLTPSAKGGRSYTAYKTGLTFEDIQKERDEVLDCRPENIRALSAHLKAFLEDDKLCVVGNSNKIKENRDLFRVVENLL